MKQPEEPQEDPVQRGIGDLSRRLRILEERYTVLRRKGQLAEQNLLTEMEHLRDTLSTVTAEANELRKLLVDVDDKLDRFLEQVKGSARREDVLILKKYLEFWDPMRYLTREEAERMLARHAKT